MNSQVINSLINKEKKETNRESKCVHGYRTFSEFSLIKYRVVAGTNYFLYTGEYPGP